MLFSATLSYRVRELAFEQMNNAEYIEVEPEQKTGHRIKEELFYPSNEEKMRLLQTLIEEEWPDRAIIFANTKHRCEEIWGHLAADGHRVGLLTGDVAQKKRLRGIIFIRSSRTSGLRMICQNVNRCLSVKRQTYQKSVIRCKPKLHQQNRPLFVM